MKSRNLQATQLTEGGQAVRHHPSVCGLDAGGRLLCPACAAEAAELAATVRDLTDQANESHDEQLARLEAFRDLICCWPKDGRGLADEWAVTPDRQARRRRALRDIGRALMEVADA